MPLTAHAGLLVQSVDRNVVLGGVNAMARSWYSANVTPAVLPWAIFILHSAYCWSIVSHIGMENILESKGVQSFFSPSVWQEGLASHE